MKFNDKLNEYMDLLDCSAKDVCKFSNLSPAIVSRYINGKRTPRINSEYLEKIAHAFCEIAKEKNIKIQKEDVLKSFTDAIIASSSSINYDALVDNLNTLFLDLNINNSDFAKALGYDSSFISKIRRKNRKPADLDGFIDSICDYMLKISSNSENKKILARILSCPEISLNDSNYFEKTINKWLTSPHTDNSLVVQNFLTTIDNFDLNSYINMDFYKIKVPTSPVIIRNSKTFYGKERQETI